MIKSFLTRLMTSGFILIIFALMLVASFFNYAFEITISLISMLCIYEAINAIGFSKKKRFLIPSMLYAFFVPVSFIFINDLGRNPYYLIIILTFLYLISFMLVAMINFNEIKFNDL